MNALSAPSRPALRWHGGKWLLAPFIIGHLPPHRYYVEPFGGAASVLVRKPRAFGEVYNDLDSGLVNFFQVLRDPRSCALLVERLELTPFSREEWEAAYEPTREPVESAARLVIRSFMGFGNDGARVGVSTGFRASISRCGSIPARDWRSYPASLQLIAARFRGVVVEHRDALACMAYYDKPDTLFYLDPPYLPETRTRAIGSRGYAHDMTAADHGRLLAELPRLAGMVVLSGYASPLYDAELAGWRRVERKVMADGAQPRTEVLWLNAAASRALATGRLL